VQEKYEGLRRITISCWGCRGSQKYLERRWGQEQALANDVVADA
jgi:hypothetical protein